MPRWSPPARGRGTRAAGGRPACACAVNLGPGSLDGSGAVPPPTTLSVGGSVRAPEKRYIDAFVKRYILSHPGLHQPVRVS